MRDRATFNAMKVGLANPRSAPKALRQYVCNAFHGIAADALIETSSATRLADDFSLCHVDDVVLIREAGAPDLLAGQVLNHVNMSGSAMPLVNSWGKNTGEPRCGAAMWTKTYNPRIMPTSYV